MTNIVAFTGLKGSGKDTAATILKAAGYEEIKFAGALKAMFRAFLYYQNVDSVTVERMVEGDLKETPSEYLSGVTPRYFMQMLGTEFGRKLIDEEIWVNALVNKVEQGDYENVVITDLRFPNESDAITKLGGASYRLQRDIEGNEFSQHESEKYVTSLPVKAIIDNNGTIDDLESEVALRFCPDISLDDLRAISTGVKIRVQISFDLSSHPDWYEDLSVTEPKLDILRHEVMDDWDASDFGAYIENAANRTVVGSLI
ncbi:MAG: hypothetical protein RIA09_16305 [Hoeflea sp.]|jgi:hypothetical protein|uniref:deoxynucleotide monophosphate kinase family protein n=1 Tax=Hoeflea sp. TaxID=1940281 RepID=UPI0032EE5F7B